MTKLLLLDCDGTIREPLSGKKFISYPRDQKIIEGADKAIAYYHSQGWLMIGVTNQGGVAANHKSIEDAIIEQFYTLTLFPELSYILFCPDYGGEEMWKVWREADGGMASLKFSRSDYNFDSFRKPCTGMLEFVLLQHDPDPPIWMVGDRRSDEASALAAGINFMPADIWRDRFELGMKEFEILPQQLEFLERYKCRPQI